MPNPISYRPTDNSRRMLSEMMEHWNQDTPAILNRAIAELYRIYQQETVKLEAPPVEVSA
jgi:DNA-binding PadR family transcriptional regulator